MVNVGTSDFNCEWFLNGEKKVTPSERRLFLFSLWFEPLWKKVHARFADDVIYFSIFCSVVECFLTCRGGIHLHIIVPFYVGAQNPIGNINIGSITNNLETFTYLYLPPFISFFNPTNNYNSLILI